MTDGNRLSLRDLSKGYGVSVAQALGIIVTLLSLSFGARAIILNEMDQRVATMEASVTLKVSPLQKAVDDINLTLDRIEGRQQTMTDQVSAIKESLGFIRGQLRQSNLSAGIKGGN